MSEDYKLVSEKKFNEHLAKFTKVFRYRVVGGDPKTIKYFTELNKDSLRPIGYCREKVFHIATFGEG